MFCVAYYYLYDEPFLRNLITFNFQEYLLSSEMWRCVVRRKLKDFSEEWTVSKDGRVSQQAENRVILFAAPHVLDCLTYSSSLKREPILSSELSVCFYQIIHRHISEDIIFQSPQTSEM
jgi:hypothetical protein